ncbi:MAG: hypothetical protein CVV44_17840 [Spirochaetae bacterium HGW-Spirochaetae-1]|jgi:diguanylate cyclase (GGDEF)-like protein|nr:MAG: hypothetical protein CVV44_17840 [Spirochaetae bacterium HGW-Spirochaetae-1]
MTTDKRDDNGLLNDFQLRNVAILTHLLVHDAVTDEIVENLRKSELDYFSLLNKYKLLEQKINIDEKTNLLKYRQDYLTDIIKTASRIYYGTDSIDYNVSLVRFDIDDFSLFNNKYGHEVGDQVLIAIADIIRNNSRPTDYVIRFGGEEFDVILPSTSMDGTLLYLERVFREIRNATVEYNAESLGVTVSAGISSAVYNFTGSKVIESTGTVALFKKMQQEADDALYEAKYLGKNRYCLHDPSREKEYAAIRDQYSRK